MNIFTELYLKLSKNRFRKTFKPLGIKKRRNFLVSAPCNEGDFIKALPFIDGLKKLGSIVMLVSHNLKNIYQCMRPHIFEPIFCESSTEIFTKEYNVLKEKLGERRFHFLVELNKPANISLPYLTPIEKRVCFYDRNKFPYYNIMIKDSITSLNDFFEIKESNPQLLFHFSKRDLRKVIRKLNKKEPLLFVNGRDDVSWEGDRIIVGENIAVSDPEIYGILYICDAYCGKNDTLFEFAKLFKKPVLRS